MIVKRILRENISKVAYFLHELGLGEEEGRLAAGRRKLNVLLTHLNNYIFYLGVPRGSWVTLTVQIEIGSADEAMPYTQSGGKGL